MENELCKFNGELGVDVNCSQTHHKTVSMCHEKRTSASVHTHQKPHFSRQRIVDFPMHFKTGWSNKNGRVGMLSVQ